MPPLPLEKALELFKQHVGGETTTEAADNIPELVESAKATCSQDCWQAITGKTSHEEGKHGIYLRISSFPLTAEKARRDQFYVQFRPSVAGKIGHLFPFFPLFQPTKFPTVQPDLFHLTKMSNGIFNFPPNFSLFSPIIPTRT